MPLRRAKHAQGPEGEQPDGERADAAEAGSARPGSTAAPSEQPDGSMEVLLDAFGAADPSPPADPADAAAAGRFGQVRLSYRRWRRTRPFWAGLWCLVGGAFIIAGPVTVFHLVLVSGTAVWGGFLLGALICVMGLFMWFSPQLRKVLGVVAVMLSIVSLVASNFGGFLFGLLFGSLGGAMAFAWAPLPVQAADVGGAPEPGTPPGTGASADPAQPDAAPAAGEHHDGEPARQAREQQGRGAAPDALAARRQPAASAVPGHDPLARS
jgi:hypothetical protein